MRPRRVLAGLCVCLVLSPTQLRAAPSFVPSPRQAFEGFVAINAPRPEVPVGALWIDGYGPNGEPASADNLETVRSLNGVTIDKGLQLALTAGLFNLLGVEPRLRDRHTARFTDLTIVRVKDISRLAGPKGEPRIIEALKAGTVLVTTDGEIGINGRTLGGQQRDVEATTSNGRTRNYAIEGRDLFVAIRVATPKLILGEARELDIVRVSDTEASARIDDYLIVMRGNICPLHQQQCAPGSFGVIKLNSFAASAPAEQVAPNRDSEARLSLPVPVADSNGSLFDALTIRWIAPCAVQKGPHCAKQPRLLARFQGMWLEDLKSPNAKGW